MKPSRSRREFLKRSATAAAGAALAASTARAETLTDPRPVPRAAQRAPLGPNDPVRIGVIGTGGMGTAHCEAFLKFAREGAANVRIEALSDVCDSRWYAAKTRVDAAQNSDVPAYRDYRQLLERPDLHGVLIASPEHWHGQMAEDAIRAGKDV